MSLSFAIRLLMWHYLGSQHLVDDVANILRTCHRCVSHKHTKVAEKHPFSPDAHHSTPSYFLTATPALARDERPQILYHFYKRLCQVQSCNDTFPIPSMQCQGSWMTMQRSTSVPPSEVPQTPRVEALCFVRAARSRAERRSAARKR